jgi:hypothetical protein
MGAGAVLGRDAAIGFGPRIGFRTGWTNLPHAWQTTAHLGYAMQGPSLSTFEGERVRPLLDADFRAGFSYALANSLQTTNEAPDIAHEARLMPVFGFTVGGGFTF